MRAIQDWRNGLSRVMPAILISVGLSSPATSRDLTYGMNYNVISTDASLSQNCASDPNATVRQQFFMARYSSSSVRKTVQSELKDLHSSGFAMVRSFVQLYPGDHPSGDLTNIEKIDEKVVSSIRDYARDVRDAGFKKLIVAFGAQGAANPGCRKSEWGDCFDASTIDASVNAEASIVRAVQSVSGISLAVDVLNEACVSAIAPPLSRRNYAAFIRAAVKMHAANFHAVPATVSCQLERTGDGLVATRQLFIEGGDDMGFFDIHAYPGATDNEAATLAQAALSLKGADIPLILGETIYGDPGYRQSIVEDIRAAFHQGPQALIFWPVRSMASHCNFDVPQPYRLRDAAGWH